MSGGSKIQVQAQPIRVLVDMDGVVANFELHLFNTYRAEYPDLPFIKLEDREGLYADVHYEKLHGSEIADILRDIINRPKYFREIPVIEGAVATVKKLSQMEGVEVFFCTSQMTTSNYSATEKLDWITEHFGQDWVSRAILTADKTMIQGDLLIDDKPNICGSMKYPKWRQVLFTDYHNSRVDITENPLITTRMDGWADIQKVFRLIEDCRLVKNNAK